MFEIARLYPKWQCIFWRQGELSFSLSESTIAWYKPWHKQKLDFEEMCVGKNGTEMHNFRAFPSVPLASACNNYAVSSQLLPYKFNAPGKLNAIVSK